MVAVEGRIAEGDAVQNGSSQAAPERDLDLRPAILDAAPSSALEDHGRLIGAAIGAEGNLAGWMAVDEVELDTPQRIQAWCLRQNGQRDDLPDVPAGVGIGTSIDPPSLTAEWTLFPVRQAGRPALYLLDMTALRVRARIVLEGELESIRARFQEERLIVFDGCGRVLAISLASGAVLREYRLT
jgi:hypothetical protein